MLKLQLTLLLQLNRCRRCPFCYKNHNRVTPTRQRKCFTCNQESYSIVTRRKGLCKRYYEDVKKNPKLPKKRG